MFMFLNILKCVYVGFRWSCHLYLSASNGLSQNKTGPLRGIGLASFRYYSLLSLSLLTLFPDCDTPLQLVTEKIKLCGCNGVRRRGAAVSLRMCSLGADCSKVEAGRKFRVFKTVGPVNTSKQYCSGACLHT